MFHFLLEAIEGMIIDFNLKARFAFSEQSFSF